MFTVQWCSVKFSGAFNTGVVFVLCYASIMAFNFNEFPSLKLDSGDVNGSWKRWFDSFQIVGEMVSMRMGKDEDGNHKFSGRTKLLALLHAIGSDGRDALRSVGFRMLDENSTYDEAIAHLVTIYGTDETVYVKTMRFVTVSQTACEKESDYLLRVEKLSRNVNFGGNEDVRKEFALAIAVNGLREGSLRRHLMQQTELNWKILTDTLRARKLARESDAILESARYKTSELSVSEISTKAPRNKSKVRGASRYSSSDSSACENGEINRISQRQRKSYYDEGSKNKYSRKWSRNSGYESPRYDRRSRYRDSSRSSRDSSVDRYNRNWRVKSKDGHSPKSDDECYNCGSRDHRLRSCPAARCFICNKKGHTSIDCKKEGAENTRKGEYRHRYNRSSSRESDQSRGKSPNKRDSHSTRSHFPSRSVRFSSAGPK